DAMQKSVFLKRSAVRDVSADQRECQILQRAIDLQEECLIVLKIRPGDQIESRARPRFRKLRERTEVCVFKVEGCSSARAGTKGTHVVILLCVILDRAEPLADFRGSCT